MKEAKKIYNLKLFEALKVITGVFVIRVPGGWIFENTYNTCSVATTFVPYNEEFLEVDKGKNDGERG